VLACAPESELKIGRRQLLVALTLFGGLSTPPAGSSELDEIRALADSGRADKALPRLEQLLTGRPDHLEAQLLRGVLLVELERTIEAERVFLVLRNQYPDRPEPVNNLAVLQAASGRRASAIAALEEVVARYPTYQTAVGNLEQIRRGMPVGEFDPLSPDASRAQLYLTAELGSHPRVEPAPSPPVPDAGVSQASAAESRRPSPKAVAPAAAAPEPGPAPVHAAALPEAEEPASPEPAGRPAAAVRPAGTEPAAAESLRGELTRLVTGWADAWSRQRIKEYLDFYAPDFQPAGHASHEDWERERRRRVSTPRFIEVEVDLESMKIGRSGAGEASVTFLQRYRSDRFGDTVEKTLDLTRIDGVWRIRREESR
jgi:hypothetical protein